MRCWQTAWNKVLPEKLIVTCYFSKTYFSIILSPAPRFSKWALPFSSSNQNITGIYLPRDFYMSHQSHTPFVRSSNISRRLQIMIFSLCNFHRPPVITFVPPVTFFLRHPVTFSVLLLLSSSTYYFLSPSCYFLPPSSCYFLSSSSFHLLCPSSCYFLSPPSCYSPAYVQIFPPPPWSFIH